MWGERFLNLFFNIKGSGVLIFGQTILLFVHETSWKSHEPIVCGWNFGPLGVLEGQEKAIYHLKINQWFYTFLL